MLFLENINIVGYITNYVIFKRFETVIDAQHIRLGLKWNLHVSPFYPKSLLQSQTIILAECHGAQEQRYKIQKRVEINMRRRIQSTNKLLQKRKDEIQVLQVILSVLKRIFHRIT